MAPQQQMQNSHGRPVKSCSYEGEGLRPTQYCVMQAVDLEVAALHHPGTITPNAQPLRQTIQQTCPRSAFLVVFHTKTPNRLKKPHVSEMQRVSADTLVRIGGSPAVNL